MTPKALVIDDDPDILEAVADILKSMGHECDCADSVESARAYLDENQDHYSYVLLDLEIPVSAGRSLARIQNGENLLEEIIRRSGTQRKPVIVMTAHGTDGPELAVDVMKKGAKDYVTKPFKSSGPSTLDKSIREALARQNETSAGPPRQQQERLSANAASATSSGPNPFDGGTMVFHPDRVELHAKFGVAIICDNQQRSRRQRKALELFRQREGTMYVRYDCDQLAERLDISGGSSRASGFVRSLRNRIHKAMLEQVNVECNKEDVICLDNGFCLSEKLIVQNGDDPDSPQDQGHVLENPRGDVLDRVPNVRNADVPDVPDDAAARRDWILQRLVNGVELKAPVVAKQFKCSVKTAQRDLTALKDEGKIEYVGAPKTGYYRLCQPPPSEP